MQNDLEFWPIIRYLKTFSEITDLVGNNIIDGLPPEEIKTPYITLSTVTDSNNTGVNKFERVSVSVIWGNENVKFSELKHITNIITQKLFDYKWDWVYWVNESSKRQWYLDKNVKVVNKDFVFFYTT